MLFVRNNVQYVVLVQRFKDF